MCAWWRVIGRRECGVVEVCAWCVWAWWMSPLRGVEFATGSACALAAAGVASAALEVGECRHVPVWSISCQHLARLTGGVGGVRAEWGGEEQVRWVVSRFSGPGACVNGVCRNRERVFTPSAALSGSAVIWRLGGVCYSGGMSDEVTVPPEDPFAGDPYADGKRPEHAPRQHRRAREIAKRYRDYADAVTAGVPSADAAEQAGFKRSQVAELNRTEPVLQALDARAHAASVEAVGNRVELLNRLRSIWRMEPEKLPKKEQTLSVADVIKAGVEWARLMGFDAAMGAGDEKDPRAMEPDELVASMDRQLEALKYARESVERVSGGGEVCR